MSAVSPTAVSPLANIANWREAGFDDKAALDWANHGFTPALATKWRELGYPSYLAASYDQCGVSAEEGVKWRGVWAGDAAQCIKHGVTPDAFDAWANSNLRPLTVAQIRLLDETGLKPALAADIKKFMESALFPILNRHYGLPSLDVSVVDRRLCLLLMTIDAALQSVPSVIAAADDQSTTNQETQ